MKTLVIKRWAAYMLLVLFSAMGVVVHAADLGTNDVALVSAGAQGFFNSGGGLGLTLLTISVAVAALMYGWKLRSGRGR